MFGGYGYVQPEPEPPLSKERFAECDGIFTWFLNKYYYIETDFGTFVWENPDQGGDNCVRRMDLTLNEYAEYIGQNQYVEKGMFKIRNYVGETFSFFP